MSAGKPPDFEPLASSDPVPGQPADIASLGKRYTDTAAEIAAQAANLRKLAAAAPGGWVGQAGSVFHSHAADLAGRISQAHDRYAATGAALTAAAGPMGDAQERAWAAVWAAKGAQQQLTANAPAPPPPPGSPPPTTAEKAEAQQKSASYSAAQGDYAAAVCNFDDAVSDYQSAAARAAGAISTAIDHDGLKDSWWDRNFGWISTVFKIIAIVVVVLAIVAVILLIPGVGEALAGMLVAMGMTAEAAAGLVATLSTAIELTAAALTACQAVFDGIAAGTGKESWTSFVMDLVSLAAFGLGAGAGKLTEVLAEGAESTGQAVSAGRAGRAAMGPLLGWVYSLGSKSPEAAEAALRGVGLDGRFSSALAAAKGASEALETAVKAAEPEGMTALLFKSSDVADSLAKLTKISEEVPGVVRIALARGAATGVAAANAGVQWTSFAAGDGYDIASWLSSNGDQAAIAQAVSQFRQAESRVP